MRAFSRLMWMLLALALAVTTSQASYAASSYKFCARWGFTYIDQNLGEDHLKHDSGLTYGVKSGAYSWAEVYRDGDVVWQGYLSSAGCTSTLPGTAGSYEMWTTAELQPPNGALIQIFPTDVHHHRWFVKSWQLNTASTEWTLYANFGIGDFTANVASAVAQMLSLADHGFLAGQLYRVYAEQNCPTGGTSCYRRANQGVYLGENAQFSTWDASFKGVVLHELGHAVQDRLFGLQQLDYLSDNPSQALCRCDDVFAPADRLHCIQSREVGGSAQTEGFGHFIATVAQNTAADVNAWFPYYKEVRWSNNVVYPPPVGLSAYGPTKWMESYCPAANRGTELDWTGFYYWIHRRSTSAFSLAQIGNVYKQACGGVKCTQSVDTPWSSLRAAADALHGSTSAKAQFWRQQGDAFGVDF